MILEDPVVDLLGKAIADAGTTDGPASVLSFVEALVPYTSSFSTVLRPNGRPIHLQADASPDQRDAVVDAYLNGAHLLDPFYVLVRRTRGTRLLWRRNIQPDDFRKTEFFRNYYKHTRLVDEMGILVERRDGSHILVSLGLARGARLFSKRECDRLAFFLPVIAALLLKNWDTNPAANTDESASNKTGSNLTLDQILEIDKFGLLTTRERAIVKFILLGHSSKSIARCLDIAVGTVKNHRKNIYRKLKIKSQSALFALLLRFIG